MNNKNPENRLGLSQRSLGLGVAGAALLIAALACGPGTNAGHNIGGASSEGESAPAQNYTALKETLLWGGDSIGSISERCNIPMSVVQELNTQPLLLGDTATVPQEGTCRSVDEVMAELRKCPTKVVPIAADMSWSTISSSTGVPLNLLVPLNGGDGNSIIQNHQVNGGVTVPDAACAQNIKP